ncbi:MAG: hypothetical protein II820_10595 [Ruminiclostridium sp.]|nr:hypothetical protein [Ruminiclostridium sp.]
MNISEKFFEAASMLPPFVNSLRSVPPDIAASACEIRLRTGRPVIVETPSRRHTCTGTSVTADNISACVKHFCGYSLYSAERELSEGRITLRGGHRAGLVGTAVTHGDRVTAMKDISSVNLRIAAEHKGIAEKLVSLAALESGMKGLVLLGPPLSAKTTMLRDCARIISSFAKTVIIDETGEIAAMYRGVPQNDIGVNCDVLDMFPKKEGIMRAVRLMSPEYLICDEVMSEYEELAECAGRGVKLILSVHCGSMAEAAQNSAVRALTDSGAVNYAALLSGGGDIGRVKGLWRVNGSEDIGSCGSGNDLYRGRSRVLVGAQTAVQNVTLGA